MYNARVRWLLLILAFGWGIQGHAATWQNRLQGGVAQVVVGEEQTVLEITSGEGETFRFRLEPSTVLHPDLAVEFPAIQTWTGESLVGLPISVRCDQSPAGLNLQIFTPDGMVYLDQPSESARQRDRQSPELDQAPQEFSCLTEATAVDLPGYKEVAQSQSFTQVRTFRLAVTVSGEYTQFHGGTVESAMAAVVTVVNRLNGIYLRELGIQFVLVPGMQQLIFTNPATDPFTTSTPSVSLLQQVQNTFDQIIGNGAYDVGILFNTGTYGLAYFGSVCDPARKGSACIGLPAPTGEQFTMLVAHEMAHQFGANHTFNSQQGMCGGARNGATAVEPGTGSTLMSYAGLACANDSLQPLMADYFHAESIREIRLLLGRVSCGQFSATTNHAPTVVAPGTILVPTRTPFFLTATGSDPDGDQLFYTWEQMNTGPAQTLLDPDNGLSPLFRSFAPTTNAVRVFPNMNSLLQNSPSLGEKLPETNRTMRFRVTVRDARNNGATAHADTFVEVVGGTGPFRFTSHNQGGSFRAAQTITWNVAGTADSPISATHVNILLSTNGGQTFCIPLALNVPNAGHQQVIFPAINTEQARLKLEAVGRNFFAVNEANFTISEPLLFTKVEKKNNTLVLRWPIQSGKLYRLEFAQVMSDQDWQELSANRTTLPGEIEAIVPLQSSGNRFFRVVELE
ncbi:MAG: reprolysin-like metallopeptidase [Limisphaerales bacterium]